MQHVAVWSEDGTTPVGTAVEIADTALTRLFGLLGRKGVTRGGGLWIRPSSGVHTFFMMFPIDVIGLDKERRVVKLWHGLRPWRMTSVSLQVNSVIELPEGQIAACGVKVGQQLRMTAVTQETA